MTPNARPIIVLLTVAALALSGCTSPSSIDSDSNDQDPKEPGPGTDGASGTESDPSTTTNTVEVVIDEDYTFSSSLFLDVIYLGPLNADCPAPFDVLNPVLNPGGPENIGGACFDIPEEVANAVGPNETARVHLKIQDDSSPIVGGYVQFFDSAYGFTDGESMCNEADLDIPERTTGFRVILDGNWCLPDGGPGAATAGTITATFTVSA